MSEFSEVYIVILAGGSGTRFWPKSRTKSPKQLCQIGDSTATMIEETLNRIDTLVPPERRMIVTHEDQLEKTKEIVGDRVSHFIAEPCARDTAHALGLAALSIQKLSPTLKNLTMVSLHADAVVQNVEAHTESLKKAVQVASLGGLTLMGVVPDYPATGFGYIERGVAIENSEGFKVASFNEKPPLDVAESYLKQGNYFWNSGIFTWKVSSFLSEFEKFLPESLSELKKCTENPEALSSIYHGLPKISIDHGLLEKSTHVSLVTADLGWRDVGSWDALSKYFKTDESGNFIRGEVLTINSDGCTIESDGPLIAAVGVKDLVIVHHGDAILVCPKDQAQEVKQVVAMLKDRGREDLT